MRRFFWILLLLLIANSVMAEGLSDSLHENIKKETIQKNPQLTFEVPQKKDTKQLYNEIKPVNNEIKPANNDIILNDKVLNMIRQQDIRPNGIIYKESQTYVNAINPKNYSNGYPGQRGPNQLIVYTPAYGSRTGTNEFGTEAIVEDNMVVSMNGADSIIPRNGFVISGHGRGKKWILQNLQIGTKVYIDYPGSSIKVFLTPESLLFAAKEKLREVSELVEYYRQIDILYNDKKANEYLNTSKEYLRKAEKKPEKTQTYINEAMENLDLAIKNALPYIPSELKGIYFLI